MFVLHRQSCRVEISSFNRLRRAISDRYVGSVVPAIGLCVAVFSLDQFSLVESTPHGPGVVEGAAVFIVFRPRPDLFLCGRVDQIEARVVHVALAGVFKSIECPVSRDGLLEEKLGMRVVRYRRQGQDWYMQEGDRVYCRITDVQFIGMTMKVRGQVDGPLLGPLAWYGDDKEWDDADASSG